MGEWGSGLKELHFEDKDYFIAWIDEKGEGYDIKKLRAFAFLEKIELPEDDDDLLRLLIDSTAYDHYLKFSVYIYYYSKEDWEIIVNKCAKCAWENFAVIDLDKFKKCKPDLTRILRPKIEKRAEKHEFFLKWGFRRPW